MNTMKIGIMSRQEFRQYTIDIAKGKIKPSPDEPKNWFDSIESITQNQKPLNYLYEKHRP